MTTLIIAAHLDDEVLASAGLIQDRIANEETVVVGFLYDRKYPSEPAKVQRAIMEQQRDNMLEAQSVLGFDIVHGRLILLEEGEPGKTGYYAALGIVEEWLRQVQPTEVVIPGRADLNQDHRHLNELCRIALRPSNLGGVTRILEALAHDTLDGPQRANYGVSMTSKMVRQARRAMECYERESRQSPHPRCPDNIEARWRLYGAQFGFEFAEPYNLIMERVL